MRVLELGASPFQLRFLADGRLVGAMVEMAGDMEAVSFEVLSPADGGRIPLNVPGARIAAWWYANCSSAIVVHPSGESCYVAWWGGLYGFRTVDGRPLPVPTNVPANQVALSPDGSHLLVAWSARSYGHLAAMTLGPKGGEVIWRTTAPGLATLAGFLPDGQRFVTVEDDPRGLRVRSMADGGELATARNNAVGCKMPLISPDGRYLGLVGYSSMYIWDLATLDEPRRISSNSNSGDFRSFAFHPDGRTVAVIHGGPTLVKVYDLTTLELVHKWNWRLGKLRSVAYSPDGTLGAAGSEDGRVVVWDVDE